MGNVAIITARGGSKRIPKKNIKDFMGRPMLSYAIDAALKSNIFDEVMVSTDDMEIVRVAQKFGAKVPFMRSAETSSDYATTIDVLKEVILEYKKIGREFENLCCIYPCVPFLKAETLKDAWKKYKGHVSLTPVCRYDAPIEWAMRIENGILVPNDREAQNIRSQDIEPKYFDAGMFYFYKTQVAIEETGLNPKGTVAYIVDRLQCQDIDTMDDWEIAEAKYRCFMQKLDLRSKMENEM